MVAAVAQLLKDSSSSPVARQQNGPPRSGLVLLCVCLAHLRESSPRFSMPALSMAAGLQADAHLQPTTSPTAAVLLPAHTFPVPTSISTSTAFIALNAPHLPFADLGVLSTAFGRYFKDLLSSGPVAAQLTSPFSKVMPLHAQVHPAQV